MELTNSKRTFVGTFAIKFHGTNSVWFEWCGAVRSILDLLRIVVVLGVFVTTVLIAVVVSVVRSFALFSKWLLLESVIVVITEKVPLLVLLMAVPSIPAAVMMSRHDSTT